MALVFKDFLHKTLIKSYEECVCAISINTNGFTGEWRVTPGFTTPAQKPLASPWQDNRCAKEHQGQRRYPEILLWSLSKNTWRKCLPSAKRLIERKIWEQARGWITGPSSPQVFPAAADSNHENSSGRANPKC